MIPLLHSHNAVQVKHTSELAYFIIFKGYYIYGLFLKYY